MNREPRRVRTDFATDPPQNALVRGLLGVGRLYARAFHDVDVVSACRLPARGPAILVCNHISGVDPVIIQSACPRLIVWMMAREYYEISAMRWGFDLIRAIPVDRGARDLAATRAALRVLHDGRVLGVFPEGRIEAARELLPFHVGTAMMALRTRAPVYPACMDGTQRGGTMLQAFFRSHRIRLAFGPAACLSYGVAGRASLEEATGEIRQAVEALWCSVSTVVANG